MAFLAFAKSFISQADLDSNFTFLTRSQKESLARDAWQTLSSADKEMQRKKVSLQRELTQHKDLYIQLSKRAD
jgi:hypothetical protein